MRNDSFLIDLLACTHCHHGLQLHYTNDVAPDGHVMNGHLHCVNCGQTSPILCGVPRFVPDGLSQEVSSTVERFGYQWNQVDPHMENSFIASEQTFLDYIYPVRRDFLRGKVMLDAGCGGGRYLIQAQRLGSAAVVGVDLSSSVDVAFRNTRHLPNVLIVQADLLDLPLRQGFDYAFSIGVLHHTADPQAAFDAIVDVVKPGGGVSAWVYGRENNGWIIYIINPIRHYLTSRLPKTVIRVLSYLITVPLFLLLKGIYGPVGRHGWLTPLRKFLVYFDYLYWMSQSGFHQQAVIVFDHLIPSIAEYIPGEDFAGWFVKKGLRDVTISQRNRNSWRGFGRCAPEGDS